VLERSALAASLNLAAKQPTAETTRGFQDLDFAVQPVSQYNSGSTHQEDDEGEEQNGSKDAAADIHVDLQLFIWVDIGA